MADLVEFLLARIDEDEQVAQAAEGGPWTVESVFLDSPDLAPDERTVFSWADPDGRGPLIVAGAHDGALGIADAMHIARHDPVRVLAECAARRAIVELHVGRHECVGDRHGHRGAVLVAEGYVHEHDPTLLLLAQVHAGHPDFDPAWAATT